MATAHASLPSFAPSSVVRDAVRRHACGDDFRIHWMALGADGLRPGERLHVSPEMSVVLEIAQTLGFEKAAAKKTASLLVAHRPTNNELISMVNRLDPEVRLLVYAMDRDLEAMTETPFEMATACIFDQDSGRAVMIYDRPRRVESYISIELADISDSAVSMQATRIATLR